MRKEMNFKKRRIVIAMMMVSALLITILAPLVLQDVAIAIFKACDIFLYGFVALICFLEYCFSSDRSNSCTEHVKAVYMGMEKVDASFAWYDAYSPIFSFDWEGKNYIQTSEKVETAEKLKEEYKEGEEYDIFIAPCHPEQICEQRSCNFSDYVFLAAGVANVLFASVGLVTMV